MRRVHFGNEQRNIGIHTVIARIADDGIAGASEILFGGTGDGRIKRGENEGAVEGGVETLDDEAAGRFRNGRVQMPASGFSVGLAGRTLGGGNFGKVKPGMSAEHLNEALADDTGGAEDSCFPFLEIGRASCRERVYISVVTVSLKKKKIDQPKRSASRVPGSRQNWTCLHAHPNP